MLYSWKKKPTYISNTYSIKTPSKNISARETRDNTLILNRSIQPKQQSYQQKEPSNKIKFQISQLQYNKKLKNQTHYHTKNSKSTQARQHTQPSFSKMESNNKNAYYHKFIESFKNCQVRKSFQQHSPIQAYAVCSKMGLKSSITNQQICIYLSQKIKILSLIEGYQGNFAANFIKKQLPGQFAKKWKYTQQNKLHNFLQAVVHQTFSSIQQRLQKQQTKYKDKSSASVLCVFIDDNRILVANCGISQAICYTKEKKTLFMNSIHDTTNESEIDRITSKGNRLYRTVINAPFSTNLSLASPIRISPSGLTYTRSIGYSVSSEKEKNSIISKPQIKYINVKDIQWLIIMNNEISNKITTDFITKTIEMELKKITLEYTLHHIAEICSRKLVAEGIRNGIDEAITIIVIFLGVKQYTGKNIMSAKIEEQSPKHNPQYKSESNSQLVKNNIKARSLKYVGNRKSFFKQSDI